MKSLNKQTIFVVIAVLLIALVPLIVIPMTHNGEEELFGGSDDAAEAMISEVAPDYKPWYEPFWEPPSGEIESLLFSLQVAIGAVFVGYAFGVLHERSKQKITSQ